MKCPPITPYKLILMAAILMALPVSVSAKHPRSQSARHAFAKEHVCPSTGMPHLPCPGYIIDHIVPLCAGGVDRPFNMQWQTIAEAKQKDKIERYQCSGKSG